MIDFILFFKLSLDIEVLALESLQEQALALFVFYVICQVMN